MYTLCFFCEDERNYFLIYKFIYVYVGLFQHALITEVRLSAQLEPAPWKNMKEPSV